jgi:hypothetical protein
MIQHHGNPILRMASLQDIPNGSPRQTELVQLRCSLIETPVFRRRVRYVSIVSCRTWAEAVADSAQPG